VIWHREHKSYELDDCFVLWLQVAFAIVLIKSRVLLCRPNIDCVYKLCDLHGILIVSCMC